MIELNKFHHGNCINYLSLLEDNVIDLTVTSPPYQDLRTYHGAIFNFEKTAQELFRVTMQGGIVCWVIGDSIVNNSETLEPFKQAIFFKEIGFNVHDTMIYQKKNFSHPEKSRYHSVFEYIFVLSKGKPKTFNPIKDRRNISSGKIGSLGINTFTNVDGSKSVRNKKINSEFGMRHNVWLGNTAGQENFCKKLKHPAMMPNWLANDLILSFSNKRDIVLDPLSGSGTTALMAAQNERNWLAFEDSLEYIEYAKERFKI